MNATNLELEVLETSALSDVTHVSKTMQDCKALGIDFSLDDFGTGYSSLTYLRRLPASLIKIDQSFIRDMLEDSDDLAIVKGVIALANNLTGLLVGLGFMGAGLGLLGPAMSAGASLAVSRDEQGGAAGLITACPAAGFVIGPVLGGVLYQVSPTYPPLFAGLVTLIVLGYAMKNREDLIAEED